MICYTWFCNSYTEIVPIIWYKYKNLICYSISYLIYFRRESCIYKFLARSVGHFLPLISFPKPQTLHSLKDDMTPKAPIPQPSRKVIWSVSQGSTTASITSSGVITRSMVKATAMIAIKQLVGTVPSESCKIPSLDSNLLEGVNKITLHPLKQRYVVGLKCIKQFLNGRMSSKLKPTPPSNLSV